MHSATLDHPPAELYDELKQVVVIHADFAKSQYADGEDFHQAYDWLVDQMRTRIGAPPAGVYYPFWAWHTMNWKHRKPDLRGVEFRGWCEPAVCLELELPDNQVLLSDEEHWHWVLNQWYMGDATNEADDEAEWARFESLPAEQALALKQKSWQKVFDVSPIDDGWDRQGCYVQATFWELRLADVRAVRRFQWPAPKH